MKKKRKKWKKKNKAKYRAAREGEREGGREKACACVERKGGFEVTMKPGSPWPASGRPRHLREPGGIEQSRSA